MEKREESEWNKIYDDEIWNEKAVGKGINKKKLSK